MIPISLILLTFLRTKKLKSSSIGYVEELGSGISKIFKYCKEYTGHTPIIVDDNIFKFTLQHSFFADSEQTDSYLVPSDQVSDQVFLENEMLEFCITAKSLSEILVRFGYKNRQYFRRKILNPLIEKKLIRQTNPNSPNSPNSPTQKYITNVSSNENK